MAFGVPERRQEEIYTMVCPRIKVQKTKVVYRTILRGTIKQLTQVSQEVSPPRIKEHDLGVKEYMEENFVFQKQSEENNGFSEHNSGSVLLDSCVVKSRL